MNFFDFDYGNPAINLDLVKTFMTDGETNILFNFIDGTQLSVDLNTEKHRDNCFYKLCVKVGLHD